MSIIWSCNFIDTDFIILSRTLQLYDFLLYLLNSSLTFKYLFLIYFSYDDINDQL